MNKQDLKWFTKTVATKAIKEFIAYFKKYARDDSFDQFLRDGNADIVDVDNEIDAALEEYLKIKEKRL